MAFPRAIALAEIGWMQTGPHNFEDFAQRLKNHLPQLDQKLALRPRQLRQTAIRHFGQYATQQPGQIQVKFNKLDSDSQIFYTTNGKDPTPQSTEYIGPFSSSKKQPPFGP